MMRLFRVVLAFALMTSTLVDADHLPQLQQKVDAEYDAADETDESETTSGDEGAILNIWCWNEEFQRYFNAYYPDVESVSKDRTTTTLKDGTTVKWTINSSLDNNYQDQLDKALMAQHRAAADDKIDIFLFEPDYAWKYTSADGDLAMPLSELGITAEDLADQYQYTKDIVTDKNGEQRAASWIAAPGVFAYRRSIAKDVLGTDAPGEVQTALSDWNQFDETAAQAKDKGYYMLSGYYDSFRVFSNKLDKPWTGRADAPLAETTTVTVDADIMAWIEQTKEFTDNGYHHKTSLWSEEWMFDQSAEAKVFGFFLPTWGINFVLPINADEEIYGDWAVCQGPQPYYWGGTWLAAAQETDNPTLVKDVILKLTCTKDIMQAMAEDPSIQDFANTISGMQETADDPYFESELLGGQNPYACFAETAAAVKVTKAFVYDQGCNEEIQNAFADYFDGYIDLDTAKDHFEAAVKRRYPEITRVVWPQ
ncbi:MAG: carbohydrate ABC transporter substrate-binding protein [Lachnospiraceae bacterium]|nr:carbohydrate ABC transporter substrate-binding protein [Lachnospiraceae bacterium]